MDAPYVIINRRQSLLHSLKKSAQIESSRWHSGSQCCMLISWLQPFVIFSRRENPTVLALVLLTMVIRRCCTKRKALSLYYLNPVVPCHGVEKSSTSWNQIVNMERSLDRKSDPDSNTGDHNVPKSQSSSSGVNESDSVSSSEDQKIDRRKDKSTGGVDVPSFNDVLNLLKFSYILQVSTKYLFYYLIHIWAPHSGLS